MNDQRLVPVELLEKIYRIGVRNPSGWYAAIFDKLRAIIDAPGVENNDGPITNPLHPRFIAGFKKGYAAGRERGMAAKEKTLQDITPAAPVQRLPEGCAWAVTKGDHSICQPPKSWYSKKAPMQAVPDEWQLVPKEPTEAMQDHCESMWNELTAHMFGDLYRAMLAAAPQPPKEIGE